MAVAIIIPLLFMIVFIPLFVSIFIRINNMCEAIEPEKELGSSEKHIQGAYLNDLDAIKLARETNTPKVRK